MPSAQKHSRLNPNAEHHIPTSLVKLSAVAPKATAPIVGQWAWFGALDVGRFIAVIRIVVSKRSRIGAFLPTHRQERIVDAHFIPIIRIASNACLQSELFIFFCQSSQQTPCIAISYFISNVETH